MPPVSSCLPIITCHSRLTRKSPCRPPFHPLFSTTSTIRRASLAWHTFEKIEKEATFIHSASSGEWNETWPSSGRRFSNVSSFIVSLKTTSKNSLVLSLSLSLVVVGFRHARATNNSFQLELKTRESQPGENGTRNGREEADLAGCVAS